MIHDTYGCDAYCCVLYQVLLALRVRRHVRGIGNHAAVAHHMIGARHYSHSNETTAVPPGSAYEYQIHRHNVSTYNRVQYSTIYERCSSVSCARTETADQIELYSRTSIINHYRQRTTGAPHNTQQFTAKQHKIASSPNRFVGLLPRTVVL